MNLLVSRYAEPFYRAAKEAGEIDRVRADLESLATLWNEPAMHAFMLSPQVPDAEKIALVKQILPDASKLTINFFKLAFERGREEILPDIPGEFFRRVRSDSGIVKAITTSAVTLSPDQQTELAKKLGTELKKTVELEVTVDPSLIGGMVIEIEGKRYDGSIIRRLDSLKHKMVS